MKSSSFHHLICILIFCTVESVQAESTRSCPALLRMEPVSISELFRLTSDFKTQISGRNWTQTLYFGSRDIHESNATFYRTRIIPVYEKINSRLSLHFEIPDETELFLQPKGIGSVYSEFTGRVRLAMNPVTGLPLSASNWSAAHEAILAHEYGHHLFEASVPAQLERLTAPALKDAVSRIDLISRYQRILYLAKQLEAKGDVRPGIMEFLKEVGAQFVAEAKTGPLHADAFELLRGLITPANELFADTVAVIHTGDPEAMYKANRKINFLDDPTRSFKTIVHPESWTPAENPYEYFGLVRSYLWNSVLVDYPHITDRVLILRILYDSFWEEINHIGLRLKALDQSSLIAYLGQPGQQLRRNERVIENIKKRLPKATDTP